MEKFNQNSKWFDESKILLSRDYQQEIENLLYSTFLYAGEKPNFDKKTYSERDIDHIALLYIKQFSDIYSDFVKELKEFYTKNLSSLT